MNPWLEEGRSYLKPSVRHLTYIHSRPLQTAAAQKLRDPSNAPLADLTVKVARLVTANDVKGATLYLPRQDSQDLFPALLQQAR